MSKILFTFTLSLVAIFSLDLYALRNKDGQIILDKLDDYELCQSQDSAGTWCHDAMRRWVEMHPDDAFKAGKMTRRRMNSWVAMPFLAQGLAAKMGDCGDEDVKLAVVSALGQSGAEGDVGEAVKAAKSVGFGACYDKLKPALISGISTSDKSYLANACPDLLKKKALTGLKQKLCEKQGAVK